MQRYEVLSLIGEGAYGSVYKARRKCNNEFVAIKKFKDNIDKTNNREIKRTIAREIKMLRQLQNLEHVVQLQDQYKRRGRIHLIFEYIDQSLLNLLEANPAGLSNRVVNNLLIQLLEAINWCHENNIIHRDIKPENLLVDSKTNNLKLCDFGFARNMQKDDEEPVTQYVATRWYRAPELLVGTNMHTTAVDIWPVGCIWVEMCSSEPLFRGDSEIDQIYIIQEGLGHPLPPNLLNFFKNNAKYSGLSLPQPELYSKDTNYSLNKRLKKQHSVSFEYFQKDKRLLLLAEMLKLDPTERIGIKEAIKFIETGGKGYNKVVKSKSSKTRLNHENNEKRQKFLKPSLPKLDQNLSFNQNQNVYEQNFNQSQSQASFNQNQSSFNQNPSNFNQNQSSFNQNQSNFSQNQGNFNQKQGNFNQIKFKSSTKKSFKVKNSSSNLSNDINQTQTSSKLKLPKITGKNIVGNSLLSDLLDAEELYDEAFEDGINNNKTQKNFLKRKLDQ